MNVIGLSKERFSRRALLKRLGVGAAVLPLLNANQASAAGPRKRFMSYTWNNGLNLKDFHPSGDMIEPKALLKPFVDANLMSKLLMPIGLNYTHWIDHGESSKGHDTFPGLLTGCWRGTPNVSLDYVIAEQIAKEVQLPRKLLTLGVRPYGSDPARTSWSGPGRENKAELDPYKIYDELFAGASLPPVEIENIRARRQSVIDFVRADLTRFGSRLGVDDRLKIDAHLSSIRELEADLAPPSAQSGSCQVPTLGTKIDLSDRATTPAHTKMMLDLIVMAFKCDISRVATFDPVDGQMNSPVPWLGISDLHHKVAHAQNGGKYAEKLKIDGWYFSQVAYVAKQLDQIVEGDKTLLDNTVILSANAMEDGTSHYVGNIPFLLLGSCGGYFRTGGRAVRYARLPHNLMLAALAQAFGINVTSFGDKYPGVLTGLT